MAHMNTISPFSLNGIRECTNCSTTHYLLENDDHEESLYCVFTRNTYKQRYYFFKNEPITSNWMTLFGYGDTKWEDETQSNHPITLLRSAFSSVMTDVSILEGPKTDKRRLAKVLLMDTPDSFEVRVRSCLAYLELLKKTAPALCYCYPMFFHCIKDLMNYYDGITGAEETIECMQNHLHLLLLAVGSAMDCYEKVRSYAQDVLITPYEDAQELEFLTPPKSIVSEYTDFCERLNETSPNSIEDFYAHSYSTPFPNAGAYLGQNTKGSTQITRESWSKNRNALHADASMGIPIFTLNQYGHIGLEQLIDSARCIRKCNLCGRYFKVRYSSSQECCTRPYKNSKFACNEYASRKSAKIRFFEHPINAEYQKSYNRLRARIMRGKVPKDNPWTGPLKALHNKYYEKYENAAENERPNIINEYAQKNKELLG